MNQFLIYLTIFAVVPFGLAVDYTCQTMLEGCNDEIERSCQAGIKCFWTMPDCYQEEMRKVAEWDESSYPEGSCVEWLKSGSLFRNLGFWAEGLEKYRDENNEVIIEISPGCMMEVNEHTEVCIRNLQKDMEKIDTTKCQETMACVGDFFLKNVLGCTG